MPSTYNPKCTFPLLFLLLIGWGFFLGCSTRNNTASSRFYHNLTTRYNVYYHGENAFNEAYKQLVSQYQESYAEQIFLDPIEAQRGVIKPHSGGAFDKALQKGQKAIKLHSIRSKPERFVARTAADRAFYNKREFNTFLHNAWLLVGKSRFYNGDFLEAMSTFSYMARLYALEPEIRYEALLWQARSYVAMGWIHEGEELLYTTMQQASHLRKSMIYNKTVAEVALATGRPADAIAPLREAIGKEPDRLEKLRMRYLLGQLLTQADRYQEARSTYRTLLRKSPPFALEFATQLRLVEIEGRYNLSKAIAQTERLARKGRNKEVLDRLYFMQGGLYLQAKDSTQAIQAYNKGRELTTERGLDYALCCLAVGEVYYTQERWLEAQAAFAEGMPALPQSHPRYTSYACLSQQLDALALHRRVVAEQDSLRSVALLPEEQKMHLIDSAIAVYKKLQKEQERDQRIASQQQQAEALNNQMRGRALDETSTVPAIGVQSGEFYFYNPQLIAQGKAQFKQRWGSRPLEDDWRRSRKNSMTTTPLAPTASVEPSDTLARKEQITATTPERVDPRQDPSQREYYLAQLPTTSEEIAASDQIIQSGLLGMAQVFEENMERYDLSAVSLEDLLRRYPDYEQRYQLYYRLYMLAERMEHRDKAFYWKNMMISLQPQNSLSRMVASPRYIERLREAVDHEEALYDAALSRYLAGNAQEVHRLADSLRSTYPLSLLSPKMQFLKALSYVLQGDATAFRGVIEELSARNSREEISTWAQEILHALQEGRTIHQGGYTGWNYSNFASADDNVLQGGTFARSDAKTPYYAVLLYASESVNKESLLFAITAWHFASFTNLPLDVQSDFYRGAARLLVSGFANAREAWTYVRAAYAPEGIMHLLPEDALLFAIDAQNYQTLEAGASLEGYLNFLSDSIAPTESTTALVLNRYAAQQESDRMPTPSTQDSLALSSLNSVASMDRDSLSYAEPSDKELLPPSIPAKKLQVTSEEPISYESILQTERERKEREKLEAEEKRKILKEKQQQRLQERKQKEQQRKEQELLRKKAAEERRRKQMQRNN